MLAAVSYLFVFVLGAAVYHSKLKVDARRESSALASAMTDIREIHARLSAVPQKTKTMLWAISRLDKWV